jgi:hypothetical protein
LLPPYYRPCVDHKWAPAKNLRKRPVSERREASHVPAAKVVDLVLANHFWDPLRLDLEDDSDGDGLPDEELLVQ